MSEGEAIHIISILSRNRSWVKVLEEALSVEDVQEKKWQEQGYGSYLGWEWFEVHTPALVLHKMVTEKLLDISMSSRSSTYYKIKDKESIREALSALLAESVSRTEHPLTDDLFADVVGQEDVKTLLKYAIESERPVHALLSGPPASAKTLFLLALSRLPDSYYCLATTMSTAGLAEILINERPSFLMIDEIDRLDNANIGVLNSLMATGIVSITKSQKSEMSELNTKVFAAGVRTRFLPKDLWSRFLKINFPVYTEQEFLRVTSSVLQREGLTPDDATFVGKEVWNLGGSQADIRQAVQIARLSSGDTKKLKGIVRVLRARGAV